MTKIEELKAAYEAATPGEWILFDSEESEGAKGVMVSGYFGVDVCSMSNTGHVGYEHNDKFIALAHTLMPQLLEAVDLMQEACEYASPLPPELVTKIERILEKLK